MAIALVPMALIGMKELFVPDPSLWRQNRVTVHDNSGL